MLLQFNFKNFKSFKDDTTLDMTATKISELSNHIVVHGNEKILPVAAIFGANASGKSNVMDAFRYMSVYVLESFNYGSANEKRKKPEFNRPTPYLFDSQSKTSESSFEVFFIDSDDKNEKTYNYGFTVNHSGVCEEWLNYKSKSSREKYKTVFYRNTTTKELDLSGIPAKSQENIRIALNKETLIVSLGSKLKISKLKFVRDWFYKNDHVNFGEPIENAVISRTVPPGFVDDENVRKNVIKYFSTFDSSIIDFDVEIYEDDNDSDKSVLNINAVHRMNDSNQTASIPLENESAGTLKMFSLYPYLQDALDNGGVLFVDELNARLHPLLVRTFVTTFLNEELNPKHAQLVFTSHDSWQLNNNLLRRDEIWFTEKSTKNISSLYSLVDFVDDAGEKIRKDENYEKNYLLGKYGAIPSLADFDMFKGEKNV